MKKVWLSGPSTETARAFGETNSVSMFCTTIETPKAVSNPVVVGAYLTGRKATRSKTSAVTMPMTIAMVTAPSTDWQPEGDGEEHRVAGDRDDLAVGEVDEAHDREHEGEPERQQRVLRPEGERVDDLLDGVVHHAPFNVRRWRGRRAAGRP